MRLRTSLANTLCLVPFFGRFFSSSLVVIIFSLEKKTESVIFLRVFSSFNFSFGLFLCFVSIIRAQEYVNVHV